MRAFTNGRFISCGENSENFSVLVEDAGRIVYIGDELPAEYAAASTTDLGGKCVVPCFGDTHAHFTSAFLPLDTRGPSTIAGVLALVEKTTPHIPGGLIFGFGLSVNSVKEKRLPTAKELDSVEKRPLFIVKYDGHAAMCNTAMMEIMPPELRLASGMNLETGLCGGEAFQKASYFVSSQIATPEMMEFSFKVTTKSYLDKGFNLLVPVEGLGNNNITVEAVQALDGKTPLRIRTYFQTMDVDKVVSLGYKRIGGCYDTALDGCFGAEDAALREPYLTDPNNKGWLVYDQKTVTDFVKKANRAGLNIAIHGIGDAAIKQIVIAYEEALADYPREHRHVIIHADLFPAEYIERAGKLGLYCAVQSEFLMWDEEPLEYLVSIIGERAYEKHPFTKMLAAGLTLANGTDNPCTLPNALKAIHCACNHPKEEYSVDALTALKMSTLYPSKLSFDEKDMGSLEVGKVADFVVLGQHILEVPKNTIKDIGIEDIYYGGVVYGS